MTIDRRQFLSRIAAGGAILTVPALLQSCVSQPAQVFDDPSVDTLFANWFGIDQNSVASVMSTLTANGADIADAFFEVSRSNRIVFENGEVTAATADIRQGAGLRVQNGEHVGFTSTEDLRLPGILAAARAAAGPGGAAALVPPSLTLTETGNLYATLVPWSDVGMGAKLRVLEFIDEQARAADPAVESVTVRWEDGEDNVMIATLDGTLVTDTRPMARLSLIVTAARGEDRQTGFASIAARQDLNWYDDARLQALVDEAVARTMIQFEARRAPQGDMPVVLAAGTSGVLLHEAIGHSLEADLNREGKSVYADQLGSKVAESFVTIVDDARLPHESGALNVDDEGSASGRTVMIEDGILRSFVHDRASARHFGVSPTGSGRRESCRHMPMPRLTCTFMEDGPHSRDEIIAAMGDGVICETFSGGRAELGEGGFRFNVKNGWIVEKGKITAPTKDFSITGNGPELLGRITMAAADSRMDAGGWICGKKGQNVPVSQGMPTALVSSLTVTGA